MKKMNISLKKSFILAGIISLIETLIISLYFGIQINSGSILNGSLNGVGIFTAAKYFIPGPFVIVFVNFSIFIFICKILSNKN